MEELLEINNVTGEIIVPCNEVDKELTTSYASITGVLTATRRNILHFMITEQKLELLKFCLVVWLTIM